MDYAFSRRQHEGWVGFHINGVLNEVLLHMDIFRRDAHIRRAHEAAEAASLKGQYAAVCFNAGEVNTVYHNGEEIRSWSDWPEVIRNFHFHGAESGTHASNPA